MTTTHDENPTLAAAPVLYFSLELGWNTWKLAFTIGAGQKPRLRTIPARALDVLLAEIQAAKARFELPGLPRPSPVTRPNATASGSIASSQENPGNSRREGRPGA